MHFEECQKGGPTNENTLRTPNQTPFAVGSVSLLMALMQNRVLLVVRKDYGSVMSCDAANYLFVMRSSFCSAFSSLIRVLRDVTHVSHVN